MRPVRAGTVIGRRRPGRSEEMIAVSDTLVQVWERYWRDLPSLPSEAIWDVPPALAAERELNLFVGLFDPALPVVDVGCGNGTQTRFLATRFATVIGVDLSAAAIDQARRDTREDNVAYRVLDLRDAGSVATLHADIGDANLYLRTVLHQLDDHDRPAAVCALATLMGRAGRAFVVELAPEAKAVLQELVAAKDGPPPKLARVFQYGLAPAQLMADSLAALIAEAGLDLLETGALPVNTTAARRDGTPLVLPGRYLTMAPRAGQEGR